jgi:hypothetical protein
VRLTAAAACADRNCNRNRNAIPQDFKDQSGIITNINLILGKDDRAGVPTPAHPGGPDDGSVPVSNCFTELGLCREIGAEGRKTHTDRLQAGYMYRLLIETVFSLHTYMECQCGSVAKKTGSGQTEEETVTDGNGVSTSLAGSNMQKKRYGGLCTGLHRSRVSEALLLPDAQAAAAVGASALFVDSATGKLSFADAKKQVHALY